MSGLPLTDDYSTVTETTGEAVRRDAIEKMYARYSFAASRAERRDVLDVACGSGQGLSLLAAAAKSVVGGDYTPSLVVDAAKHYGSRITFVCLDAEALPFAAESFDMVLCYEALYYFPDAEKFLREAARVLRTNGELIVVSVNPSWAGFNRSPYSVRYHSADELTSLLERHGFRADVRGAFPEREGGLVSRGIGLVRRGAVRLHLVPKTMRAKRILKRLFYGRLVPLPPELDSRRATIPTLEPVGSDGGAAHTVLYGLGIKAS